MDLEAYLADIDAKVTEHGVAVQFVGSGEHEPQFGYTVGLFAVPHPEFILFGLSPELTQALLNDLAFSVLRAGMSFDAGDRVHRLLRDHPALLCGVDDPAAHLRTALALVERRGRSAREVQALQVLLPDHTGKFVGDDGYSGGGSQMLGARSVSDRDQNLPDADIRRSQGW